MATSTIKALDLSLDSQIINYTITSTTNAKYITFSYDLPEVEGYIPVGIVGFQTAASGSTPNYTRVSSICIRKNTDDDGLRIYATVRNPYSTQNASKTLWVQVLYFKAKGSDDTYAQHYVYNMD